MKKLSASILLLLAASALSFLQAQPVNLPLSSDQPYQSLYDTTDSGTGSFTSTEPVNNSVDQYALIHVNISFSSGASGGDVNLVPAALRYGGAWFEIPYQPVNGLPTVVALNDGGNSVTLFNACFELSPTIMPLSDPGFFSIPSNATPLPQLDGDLNGVGAQSQIVSLPEPRSVWLALAAMLTFLGVRRFRSARAQG